MDFNAANDSTEDYEITRPPTASTPVIKSSDKIIKPTFQNVNFQVNFSESYPEDRPLNWLHSIKDLEQWETQKVRNLCTLEVNWPTFTMTTPASSSDSLKLKLETLIKNTRPKLYTVNRELHIQKLKDELQTLKWRMQWQSCARTLKTR